MPGAARASPISSSTLRNTITPGGRVARLWGRHGLVASQIALTLVLLTVALSFYRSFQAEYGRGPGFRTDHIVLTNFDPLLARYDQRQSDIFYQRVKERVAAIPQVISVALTSYVPLNQDGGQSLAIVPEGFALPPGTDSLSVTAARVDEGYFETIGISIENGRGVLATDTADAPRVAIVNRGMANRYWPGDEPLGKRVRLTDGAWAEIVGVAADAKFRLFTSNSTPFLYLPHQQNPLTRATLVVRTEAESEALASELRAAILETDRTVPILSMRTMEDFYYANAQNLNTVVVRTIAGMGTMGLALALIGLYGLTAYTVAVEHVRSESVWPWAQVPEVGAPDDPASGDAALGRRDCRRRRRQHRGWRPGAGHHSRDRDRRHHLPADRSCRGRGGDAGGLHSGAARGQNRSVDGVAAGLIPVLSPQSSVLGPQSSVSMESVRSLHDGGRGPRGRIVDRGLWTVDRGLSTVDRGRWTADCGPWTWTVDCRPQPRNGILDVPTSCEFCSRCATPERCETSRQRFRRWRSGIIRSIWSSVIAIKRATSGCSRSSPQDFPNITAGKIGEKTPWRFWLGLARAARYTVDYVRYLTPEYAGVNSLKERARGKTSGLMRWFVELSIFQSRAGNRFLTKALLVVERAIPIDRAVFSLVERERPDVLLVTPLVDIGSDQVDYVKAAQRLGIRSALSRPQLGQPDEQRADPGAARQGLRLERGAEGRSGRHARRRPGARRLTGAMVYDQWFARRASTTRDEFCARVGLDPTGRSSSISVRRRSSRQTKSTSSSNGSGDSLGAGCARARTAGILDPAASREPSAMASLRRDGPPERVGVATRRCEPGRCRVAATTSSTRCTTRLARSGSTRAPRSSAASSAARSSRFARLRIVAPRTARSTSVI